MRIKENFVLREIAGEHIVTAEGLENINFNKLISLNFSAAFLFEGLSGKEFEVEDAAKMLIEEYKIDEALAMRDAESICKAWKEIGIVE
jgi:hypothetical protein